MAIKDVIGILTLKTPNGDVLQESNLSFRMPARYRTIYRWNNNYNGDEPWIYTQPFKQAYLLEDDDITVGHGTFAGTNYPVFFTGSAAQMTTYDHPHFRNTATAGIVQSSDIPRVIGSVSAASRYPGQVGGYGAGDETLSIVDIPIDYTQIGNVFIHPAYRTTNTVSTTLGANYVTYTNAQFWDELAVSPGGFNLVRIETGADAGFYFIQHNDWTNNRLYLRCLDGRNFSALATASGLTMTACSGRRAWFNETNIIPLSVGTVEASGRFNPRKDDVNNRNSFILRVTFDKTGSTEAAAGTEQQGSYFISLRPFTHGSGSLSDTQVNRDEGGPGNNNLIGFTASEASPQWFTHWAGGVNGIDIDWDNQRVWFGYTDASNQSSIAFWRYKTCEGFRHIACYLGNAQQANFVNPQIVLGAGDIITNVEMGSRTGSAKNWCYITIYHASGGNAGVVIIKENLTTLQYRIGDGVPASKLAGSVVDKSRAREFSNITTTASTDVIDDNDGSTFTAADVGRVIKIHNGSDAGLYKIATIVDSNTVTVQTLAGGAVSFNGSVGAMAEIGDRLYLFFNDNTTGAGKMNYMESMAPGTFLTRTVSMTNGANINTRTAGGAGLRYGQKNLCSIDRATGDVYWLSNDTQQQINKYNVTSNTHSFLTISDIQSPAGGSPANPSTPTIFTAIHVNTKFDHIWVGTDQGHVRLLKSAFSGATAKRYFGNDATTYENPVGFKRSAGWATSGINNYVRTYWEHADGRMSAGFSASNSGLFDKAWYSQESDNWHFKGDFRPNNSNEVPSEVHDPYGNFFSVIPSTAGASVPRVTLGQYEVQYQWDNANSKWVPLEVIQRGLPNKSVSDTTNPNCLTRPIHSTYEDVVFGVKLRFNRQGGSTPPNNEFLGRAGQSRTTSSDGSTTVSSATFGGSGFVIGDVGKLLRIETGADAGVYRISGYTSPTSVTLVNLNGSAFSATASASGLTYTVWDLGTPGSNAGPEDVTILLADGISKDNTQDISGLTYDAFGFKSRSYEQQEGRKFCVETPFPVEGTTQAPKVYFEQYARGANQYEPAVSHHRALPGTEHPSGRHVLDFMVDKFLDGTGAKSTMASGASWYNTAPNTTLGWSLMVDFGKDVEVGFVQIRWRGNSGTFAVTNYTSANHGLIANLYKANNAGGAPANSSVARTSGSSNLTTTSGSTTVSVSSGDFLGPLTTGPLTNGSMVAGQSAFSAPPGTFVQSDFMKVLKVTAGAGSDIGSYRIIGVSLDGSTVTIRNLDQTEKLWGTSASGVTYEVRDAVREEDLLNITSPSAHRLCIERLLTPTSAQVRTAPSITTSVGTWSAIIPTWEHVKRLSYSTEAEPPDVKNNGTWSSNYGRNDYSQPRDSKSYMDLTDLPPSRRTGRWWKFTAMPRFTGSPIFDSSFYLCSFEFYDTSGNKLGTSKYALTDQARTNPDFFYSYLSRVDFIQAAHDAAGGPSNGVNGNGNLGGVNGDTFTTTGSFPFRGFGVKRPIFTDGVATSPNTFSSATANWVSADVGRMIHITSGPNAGYYRIATRVSATDVTVTQMSGTPVSFTPGSNISFSVYEGINAGGVYPDKLYFPTDGREFTIATISDDMLTMTIAETFQQPRTSVQWEIRRPAYDTASATTEPSKTARLTRPQSTYPVQSGDICHDSAGHHRFFSEDIGQGWSLSTGSTTGGATFVGGNTDPVFHPDAVGRLLYIDTGPNVGVYEIASVVDQFTVTLVNHYTGAPASLTADAGPITFRVYGERRFRLTRYVTGLRA
jgi:hypothetical protein